MYNIFSGQMIGPTLEDVQKARDLQKRLGSFGAPRNVTEGFINLGAGIGSFIAGRRANKLEKQGRQGATDSFNNVFGSVFGLPARPPSPAPQQPQAQRESPPGDIAPAAQEIATRNIQPAVARPQPGGGSPFLAQFSTDTRAVNRPSADFTNISLDFNASPNGGARGTEVIVPDNASPEVRAAAEEYNRRIVEFAGKYGLEHPNRGVKTRSQNGRGVPHTVHTEPFFNDNVKFQNIIDQHFDEFSDIYADTFGQLDNARVIPPHGVGQDRGATSDIFTDETTFGTRVVESILDRQGNSSRSQQQPRQRRPVQVAQASGGQGQQQFDSVIAEMIQTLSNPFLSKELRAVGQAIVNQRLQANDPLRRTQLEGAQLRNQQLRQELNRQPERKIIKGADGFNYYQDTGERVLPGVEQQNKPQALGRDSRLVDPQTGDIIVPAGEREQFRQLSQEDAAALGLPGDKRFQQGPDGPISQTGGGGVNVNIGEADFKVPTGFKRDPNDPVKVVPIPGGPQDPNTPTTKTINDANKVNSASEALNKGLERYRALIEQHGGEVVPGPAKDALLQARQVIQLQAKELLNLGVLNGPDLDILDELLIDPTAIGTNAESLVGGLFGGASVKERALSSVDQFQKTFEEVRAAQTPKGFTPSKKGDRLRFNPETGEFE